MTDRGKDENAENTIIESIIKEIAQFDESDNCKLLIIDNVRFEWENRTDAAAHYEAFYQHLMNEPKPAHAPQSSLQGHLSQFINTQADNPALWGINVLPPDNCSTVTLMRHKTAIQILIKAKQSDYENEIVKMAKDTRKEIETGDEDEDTLLNQFCDSAKEKFLSYIYESYGQPVPKGKLKLKPFASEKAQFKGVRGHTKRRKEAENNSASNNIVWLGFNNDPDLLESESRSDASDDFCFQFRLDHYGLLGKNDCNYLVDKSELEQFQDIDTNGKLLSNLYYDIRIPEHSMHNKLKQPVLFSGGYSHIWVSHHDDDKWGGFAHKTRKNDCDDDQHKSCTCGAKGGREVVVSFDDFKRTINNIDVDGFSIKPKFLHHIRNFRIPDAKTLLKKAR